MSVDVFKELIQKGDVPALRLFLQQNPDILRSTLSFGNNYGGFALNYAAFSDQPEVIEFLVEEKNQNINRQEGVGNEWTPLHHAKEAKAYRAAARLISLGANPLLKNRGEDDTYEFCQSYAVQKTINPEYLETKRQKKIAGTWKCTTPQEVVHDYEMPDQHYRLTDIFNFETRLWRALAHDQKNNTLAQTILSFDDVSDTTILHQAFQKLTECGGKADPSAIEYRMLQKKSVLPRS